LTRAPSARILPSSPIPRSSAPVLHRQDPAASPYPCPRQRARRNHAEPPPASFQTAEAQIRYPARELPLPPTRPHGHGTHTSFT
jgi:hypothetical protein